MKEECCNLMFWKHKTVKRTETRRQEQNRMNEENN